MAILGIGGVAAAQSTALMSHSLTLGIVLAVFAYILIGLGVGAAGTSVLAMLAARVEPGRKAAAASIVWLMMIAGFVVTTAVAGALLEPFSFERLVEVTSGVSAVAFVVTLVALFRLESYGKGSTTPGPATPSGSAAKVGFRESLAEVWGDADAKAFTIFVFVAMLAYNTQDLILEPFAGAVFGLSPGASTQLTSVQHSGVLVGMLVVAFAASGRKRPRFGSVKVWTVGGCILSGVVLFTLAVAGIFLRQPDVLRGVVAVLGFANGAFAVAAIGWMMSLASAGQPSREGIRMGLWGGAQAIAFALGAFAGTLGVDVVRSMADSVAMPYASVFVLEGLGFWAAAGLALRMRDARSMAGATHLMGASLSPEDLGSAELRSARAV